MDECDLIVTRDVVCILEPDGRWISYYILDGECKTTHWGGWEMATIRQAWEPGFWAEF